MIYFYYDGGGQPQPIGVRRQHRHHAEETEFERENFVAADVFTDHVRNGDRIAFLCESTVDATMLWNGAMKAGATISYVHTQAPPETIRYSIDELQPEFLVVSERFAGFVADRIRDQLSCDPDVVVVGDATRDYELSYASFVKDAEPRLPDVYYSADDIAAIVWTSGTTGKQKGWCHTHGLIMLKCNTIDIHRTIRRLTASSTSFMAWFVVSTMVTGGATLFHSDWKPIRWAEMVSEYDVTQAGMMPRCGAPF